MANNAKPVDKFVMKLYPCDGIFDHQQIFPNSNMMTSSKIQNNILGTFFHWVWWLCELACKHIPEFIVCLYVCVVHNIFENSNYFTEKRAGVLYKLINLNYYDYVKR